MINVTLWLDWSASPLTSLLPLSLEMNLRERIAAFLEDAGVRSREEYDLSLGPYDGPMGGASRRSARC